MEAIEKIGIDIPILNKDTASVTIDTNIYGLTSIKKACYKFTADCSVQLHTVATDQIKLVFSFTAGTAKEAKEKLLNDFHSELLDQDLREIVFKETEPVRNLILAQAFSRTSLLNG